MLSRCINSANSSFTIRIVGVFIVLFFNYFTTSSQEKKKVNILEAEYAESVINDPTAQRVVGNQVKISHKDILMWCDTAYTYSGSSKVDAFGNVHINQGDTLQLYAKTIMYDGDRSFAQAWGNVRLINKSTTVYSDTLDYDLNANTAYYDDSGKIVDSTSTITSIIGKYFIDTDMLFFYKDVVAVNKDFTLVSDTVNYNTKTSRIMITGPTTIRDSSNTLYTEDGWYDSNTGEAELLKKPVLSNKNQKIEANYIKYNKENKSGKALGNVRIEDIENKSIILGQIAEYNDSLETAMVTDSAIYINYNETDSLFLHADTLRTVPDTIEGEKIVFAHYGVRFFRTDVQGICDSMVYFTRDSIVQLHNNPIIWSDIHQLSADLIEMQQFANAPDELHLTKNSFIISKQDSGRYDQIKGKEMIGYVLDKKLNKIDVNGNGTTLYYAREENKIIGLNRAESSKIEITFKDGKIYRINFLKAPEGELKPLLDLKEEDKTLKDFQWNIQLRPLSKYDIFKREYLEEDKIKRKETTDL